MGARVSPQERGERIRVIARQERGGQPERKADAEGVAITSCVLGGDEPAVPGDANVEHAPLGHERRDPIVDRLGLGTPDPYFLGRQVTETEQHFVNAVRMTSSALADQVLQRELEVGHRVLVQQLAKLDLAEEGAQLRGIDRQGLRTQLRERRVALVHEVRDIVEEQRRGEG